jgi:hypothetical protein
MMAALDLMALRAAMALLAVLGPAGESVRVLPSRAVPAWSSPAYGMT